MTVSNVAPVVNAGADQTAAEGATVSLAPATFTDAGTRDTHTATIDWGDGTAVRGRDAVDRQATPAAARWRAATCTPTTAPTP